MQELYDLADKFAKENRVQSIGAPGNNYFELFHEKFAELIVRDCIDVAKNWDDQLVNSNLVKESNAVGIVAYRIARRFGVEE
jgi:hypothetical protein